MKKMPMDTILDDPIVDEVRRVGQALFQDAGHDIHRLCTILKEREKCYANPIRIPKTDNILDGDAQSVQAFRENEGPYK